MPAGTVAGRSRPVHCCANLYTEGMNLNAKQQTALMGRLRLIDLELESLPLRHFSEFEQISKAMLLSKERTGLRQRLVEDSFDPDKVKRKPAMLLWPR
jgi:hypothetical protein